MVKKIFLLCLLFIPAVASAQSIFHVTTIDSFTATHAGGNLWFWGATCVDAVYEDGAIHLSFYYRGDSTETVELIYGVRISSGFAFDTVASLSPWEVGSPSGSAILIDDKGDPWVFTDHSQRVQAFHRVGDVWVSSLIDTSGYFKGIAAVERGGDEIGLVYLGQRPEGGMNSRVRYARWDGGSWDRRTLFDEPFHGHFTRPSAVKAGDDVFVSFAEGKDPDSVMVRVFGHSQGEWSEEFSDAYISPIGGVFMGERGLLGLTNEGQVHLWRQADGYSRYFIRSGSAWQSQSLTDPPGSFIRWPQGSNIALSSDHTAVLLSEDAGFNPTISWRTVESACGYNSSIPWYGYPCGITLHDPVMTPDDTLHIFYAYGYAASPYGDWDPVVFNEARVYVNDLVTSGTSTEQSTNRMEPGNFSLCQNFPNPFNPSTDIGYRIADGRDPVHTTLMIYNILGQKVATLVDGRKEPGYYTVSWDGSGMASGIYVCRLTAGAFTSTKRMILLK